MIYIVGALSGFFQDSLDQYAAFPRADVATSVKIQAITGRLFESFSSGQIGDGLKIIIRLIGEFFLMLVPSLSQFNPVPQLSEGMLISGGTVLQGGLWMAVIWGGVVALIGWLIFRNRELARVTV